ncbi:hypothetical protein [Brucella pituitosa]|uniref:hypothetical protein n=1 Tax=Brucella pituitosa TaxID=571256 RepID=UPI0012601AF3|nr:hypothetical protein [Brucella pituitosa]
MVDRYIKLRSYEKAETRMKNPVRNVVVEYKNRRTPKNAAGLWGNIDLKAIADEVEIDLPVHTPPTIVVKPNEEPAGEFTSNPQSISEDVQAGQEAIDLPPDIIGIDENVQNLVPDAIAKAPKPDKPVPIKTVKSVRAKKLPPVALQPTTFADELKILEAENAALKKQLLMKLSAENRKLRNMLARART